MRLLIVPPSHDGGIFAARVSGGYPSTSDQILVGKGESALFLLPQMTNRHGLIAGATGLGKTNSACAATNTLAPSQPESVLESVAKTTLRAAGNSLGRSLIRGVLGSRWADGGDNADCEIQIGTRPRSRLDQGGFDQHDVTGKIAILVQNILTRFPMVPYLQRQEGRAYAAKTQLVGNFLRRFPSGVRPIQSR